MSSFLMIFGFLLLAVLLVGTGSLMVFKPRRFAAACEAFAAAGNLPSLLPQSVTHAVFQVRVLGTCCFMGGLVLMSGTAGVARIMLGPQGVAAEGTLYWLVIPAALGISAGYVILVYGSEWVARTFGKWVNHPLVPQEMILALTWGLRIAGVAFMLFGLGAGSLCMKSFLHL